MRKLLILLFTLISMITYSQSGVGYLNYTVYNIYGNSVGAYANSANDFVNMFNSSSVYASGTSTATNCLYFQNQWSPSGVPNGGAYTGIKITGYFVPKETGTYYFGIDGDDGVDFLLNNSVVTSFYGPHGFGGYRVGSINLVAGQVYTLTARYQNWGGGWGLRVVWKRPSQGTYTVQSDEVTNIQSDPTKKVRLSFDFGSTLDKTKFSIGSNNINSIVDVTSLVDSTKIGSGNKANTSPGQVEWCVIYDYDNTNKRYRVGIDAREFTGTNVTPSTVNKLKLFDLWDDSVTYSSYDPNGWAEYWIYTNTQFNYGVSSYSSNLRQGNGFYGVSAEFTFAANQVYKTQKVVMTTTNTLSTLYNSIVTVTDVYLAFKELQNGGIFGNQSGNEFGYGIQYDNADVNDDGVFDESDCFALLQHLTGKKNLVDTFILKKTLKLIPQSTYSNIGKSTWNTFPSYLGDTLSFDINTGKSIDSLYYMGTWKGDVNLSHSATPPANGIANMAVRMGTMSVSNEINLIYDTELIGDSVVVSVKVNPLQQQLVAVQFALNFDKSILNYSSTTYTNLSTNNFAKSENGIVSIGSLNTSGEALGNTEYKIAFKSNSKINNLLGLISISNYEAIDTNGKGLKVKVL